MNNNAQHSLYAETTRLVRRDRFFGQTQAMQGLGLEKAYPQTEPNMSGAYLFSQTFDTLSKIVNTQNVPRIHYTFGWSGLLTLRARRQAAKKLYEQLTIQVKKIRAQGMEPYIRIIGYSHGGNVALHLAEEARNLHQTPFTVHELILLSTPIQRETKHYANHPMFKHIFNYYSKSDHIQTLDFMSSFHHSFSHRIFISDKTFKRPEKITDIQIRFIRKKIQIPQKDGRTKVLYRTDYIHPNHAEMYFFGWAALWYRKHFPIRPLPVASLIPITQRKLKDYHLLGKPVTITIVADDEKMILSTPQQKNIITPFLTHKEMRALTDHALKFQPKNYKRDYHRRIKKIKKEAKSIHRARLKERQKRRKLHTQKGRIITQQKTAAPTSTTPKNHSSQAVAHAGLTLQKKSHR
jgi:hypothetical protein